MGIFIISIILASGFIVCHRVPTFFYKLHRYEGQYLYLQAARLGAYSFFYAVIFIFSFDKMASYVLEIKCIGVNFSIIGFLAEIIADRKYGDAKNSKIISMVILSSFASMIIIPRIWSYITEVMIKMHGIKDKNRHSAYILGNILKDSPLDDALFKSLFRGENIMLTMSDRKVYVGVISSMGEPNELRGTDQEVSIKPILSGYRDKDTLKVTFTTDYVTAQKDVYLTLRQDMISSATAFDFEIYEKFKDVDESRKKISVRINKIKEALR